MNANASSDQTAAAIDKALERFREANLGAAIDPQAAFPTQGEIVLTELRRTFPDGNQDSYGGVVELVVAEVTEFERQMRGADLPSDEVPRRRNVADIVRTLPSV